ncbi:hypothetical protein, partial [Klebsiella aerogenes]|uniref:hypothetical protein n=1 Tax=Klebsiella aerogenes TaxID=548 RepID=UPI0013D46424
LSLLSELETAIAQGQLRQMLQPKLRLRDDRITGAEALVRAERGELPDAVRLGREALQRREAVVRELPQDVEYRDALVTEA